MPSSPTIPLPLRRCLDASRQSELLYRGYSRRTTAAEPRLSEIVAEYRRIGFDVEVVDHGSDPDCCNICFEADAVAAAGYKDVYVCPKMSKPIDRMT